MTLANKIDTVFQFLAPARRNLSPSAWDYLMGGTETETTLNRNRRALDSLAFRPRVLCDVGDTDTRTTLLGQELRLPVVLAPIGSLQDLTPEGGVAPTRAAATFGVVHMLSSVCAPGLEEVADAVDYPKIFQLYIRGDAEWVDEIVGRAVDNGYRAVALTVDRAHYSRRERDIAKGYLPTALRGGINEEHQARFNWRDIDRIRSKFDIPLIIKGIATPDDAMIAVEKGIACVYVSNHGGRQLDHQQASIDVLPEIVEAVGKRAEIIVDGCILRGTDIVKAIALGATAVGIGRLQGIALAAGGSDGLVRMLEILEDEVIRTLGLMGVNRFDELNARFLKRSEPLGRNWLDSAFPLVREGYGGQGLDDHCLMPPGLERHL